MPLTLARPKTVRIIEPNRATWLAQTRHELTRIGGTTTGHPSLDKALRLPNIPLRQPVQNVMIEVEDATECQLCDRSITAEFVDGVVKGASAWAMMCPCCHVKEGIGIGNGRGQRYKLVSRLEDQIEVFTKVEG